MSIIGFPPIESADESGLLAIGGDLEVDSLLLAYESGIFPWPISDEYPLAWFSPNPRGILKYENFHVSKSFKKFLNKTEYVIDFNRNFESVIMNCSMAKRKDELGTWITDDIIAHYIELFKKGYAYSAETYKVEGDQRYLIGGVYGVCISNFVSGESMYYREDNASKFALYHLLEKLHNNGIEWIDTQMVTPVIKDLGGIEVPRKEYIKMLKSSKIKERIVPDIL